jgi:hypothetical protein
MLTFQPEHVQLILDGRKTQTRRIWKRRRAVPGAKHWAATKRFDPETRFALLDILRVWQERLDAISHEDAVAEGYQSRADYLDAFMRIYHPSIKPEARLDFAGAVGTIWVVEFRVAVTVGHAGIP